MLKESILRMTTEVLDLSLRHFLFLISESNIQISDSNIIHPPIPGRRSVILKCYQYHSDIMQFYKTIKKQTLVDDIQFSLLQTTCLEHSGSALGLKIMNQVLYFFSQSLEFRIKTYTIIPIAQCKKVIIEILYNYC